MEHVNGWCFRGIYKGGLWENDLHVSALKASAKTTSCKPLSRRYEFDSSQCQYVCLDIFVNGLAVTCRSGWFHTASCLSRGVGIRLRGGKASMMGLQYIHVCWGCGWWWAM